MVGWGGPAPGPYIARKNAHVNERTRIKDYQYITP